MKQPPNPYVGARSLEAGDHLFGRDRERADLIDLLIAERIVVLYSPSGAGKTSLIQAGLISDLKEAGFGVLPIARVHWHENGAHDLRSNGYANALLYSLSSDASLLESRGRGTTELCLAETFRSCATATTETEADSPRDDDVKRTSEPVSVLVIDQFEELITTGPPDPSLKREFLDQLGRVLQDKSRWLLISMREDSLPVLDSLIHHSQFHYSARYRLDLLGQLEAMAAIRGPAESLGVTFAPEAAERLVKDLSPTVPGSTQKMDSGRLIDPMQLQLVCSDLWDSLEEGTQAITLDHLRHCVDVDGTMMAFYDRTIAKVARSANVRESTLRQWFGRRLITELDTRGTVFQGTDLTEGMPNAAVELLAVEKLLRREQRAGGNWYELPHDRLIKPIRKSNARTLDRIQRSTQSRHHRAVLVLMLGVVGFGLLRWNETSRDTRSKLLAETAPDPTPLRVAVLAYEEAPTQAADSALRAALRQPYTVRSMAMGGPARFAAYSPDSRYIAAIDSLGSVKLFDRSGTPIPEALNRFTGVSALAFSPTGSLLALGRKDGHVSLVRTTNWQEQTAHAVSDSQVRAITFHPQSSFLAIATNDGGIRIFKLPGWGSGPVLEEAGAPANSLSYNPIDPNTLVSAHHDSLVKVWLPFLQTRPSKTLRGHGSYVYAVAFHPRGHIFASASKDKTVRIWSTDTWKTVATLPAHSDNVYDVTFNRDGSLLASAGRDQRVVLRTTGRGWRKLAVLEEHTAPVRSARFSPDGKTLITASEDATLRLWLARGDLCEGCDVDSVATLAKRRLEREASNGPSGFADTVQLMSTE